MQLSLDFCRNLTLVEAHDFPMTNFSTAVRNRPRALVVKSAVSMELLANFASKTQRKRRLNDWTSVALSTLRTPTRRKRLLGTPTRRSSLLFRNCADDSSLTLCFCTTELTSSDAKELKTLIQNEWKVQPSCGQPACLSLNPKANYNNGWTANEKTSRKRRQSAANQQPAKRRKKPSKPKRRKKSMGSNGKS